ncbi:hypothetical protein [Hyphomonas johnsonii]|jgi:hypothetical protein|uniref:DUF2066 domain-containing protein n=1 Tax=Hyphomonas johnsonii MHS-2 TaxID=1280950 RepID=A0A059FU97_9PROT|nr:hypothetical protein [Hyphomonas johnsonii]KCZ94051.1 hypothetical protein HJO_01710 [Hyphomonas johnsonii MHS-2]
MIRLLFASLILVFAAVLPAAADTREVYTIRDISVDEQAASVIEARDRAMGAARVKAATALINKITLAEDRASVGGVPIDYDLASRLSAAVDVQEETAGAGRYRGVLSVVLNPLMVRAHLDSLGIPYVDTQGPLGLMVPLATNYQLQEAWRAALGASNMNALSPYITASDPGYSQFSDWSAVAPEAATVNARRGVLAELSGRDGAYRVQLSTVTTAGTELVGTTYAAPTLSDAAAAAVAYMDENWKQRSIIRTDGPHTTTNASVRYTSLAEWNTLRTALARSPLVSDFKITAIARDGALVTFAYAGDAPRLQNDLLQRGVSLVPDADGMVLTSAVSSSGVQ